MTRQQDGPSFYNLPRRRFLQSSALLAASMGIGRARAEEASPGSLRGRIYKTLKIGMIRTGSNLTERFAAAKSAGFDGVELNSPGLNVAETLKAISATGLPVDGTVCSTHWNIRHTSPDAEQRAKALRDLQTALRDTHAVGGNTVLLVVGHGKDGPKEALWKRSQENIAKALPLAANLGVYIAIENVWNQFLYEHDGPNDQEASQFARYVDAFASPWVGMQYDIGNHWKYGDPGKWIRTLGRRIVKLDVKGFSRAAQSFKKIGEGDLPWDAVRSALLDIGYTGWAAAEVGGGDAARLKEVATNLDTAFGLG